MNKAILFLMWVAVISCSGTVKKTTEKWEISKINHSVVCFTPFAEIEFTDTKIVVTGKNSKSAFPYILAKNRLVVHVLPEKLLFDIQKISDSEWELTEMYTNNPVKITLVKINH